jgi:type I restriction enzyme S subunit
MKRYEAYKDSGVEWLGEIPEQWEVKKLKYSGIVQPSNVDKKKAEGELLVQLCNYIDVYKNEFIEDSIDFMEATASEDEISKFKINVNDVLVTKDSESADDIAVPALVKIERDNLICGYHLTQIKPNAEELKGSFLFRLFQENLFKSQFTVYANGVTRFGLSVARFKDAFITLPPLTEQESIAHFLDRKTSQIDSLVEKKKRLIELLKEEKTAVINQAVTKGLDPNVKMKDSGAEWLGEIPEHWEVKKLKWVAELKSGDSITGDEIRPEGEYPVYGGNGLRGYTDQNTHEGEFVLIGRQGALCGNINYAKGKFYASEHAVVVTLIMKLNYIWLGELLRSMNLNQYSIASAQPGLSVDRVKNLNIPVPSVDESNLISSFVLNQISKIDSTISKIEKEIELLQEYRTALVSEVVTGKVRV